MATGSVARIVTNAMRGGYDDNRDNLKLSFAGATEIINEIFLPTNCTNGHESLQWINGDRVGRTNLHECKEG